jgi:Tol biopolymer transport system component
MMVRLMAWSAVSVLLLWAGMLSTALLGSQFSLYALTFDQIANRDAGVYLYDLRIGLVAPLIDKPDVAESAPRWSPDGTALVYRRRDFITVRRPQGEIPLPDVPRIPNLFWTPDATAIAWMPADQRTIYRVDVVSGNLQATTLPNVQFIALNNLIHLSPSEVLLLARAQGDDLPLFYRYHMETGNLVAYTDFDFSCRPDQITQMAFSPDRRQAAFTCAFSQNVYLLNTVNGNIRVLLSGPEYRGSERDNLIWSPDGRELLLRYVPFAQFRQVTLIVNVETGRARRVMRGVAPVNVEWTPTTVWGFVDG